MKRTMFLVIAGIILISSPAFASLTTYQSWDFSNATYNPSIDGGVWVSEASGYINPNPAPIFGAPTALIKLGDGGSYDQTSCTFTNVDYVQLFIGNYENENPLKIIEIQANYTPIGSLGDVTIQNTQEPIKYEELLRYNTSSTNTTVICAVYPNPSWESILLDFNIPAGAVNTLYGLYVETECIPAPGALFLAGIGASLVTWMRKRKTI